MKKIKFFNGVDKRFRILPLKSVKEYYKVAFDQYEGLDDFMAHHKISGKHKKSFAKNK